MNFNLSRLIYGIFTIGLLLAPMTARTEDFNGACEIACYEKYDSNPDWNIWEDHTVDNLDSCLSLCNCVSRHVNNNMVFQSLESKIQPASQTSQSTSNIEGNNPRHLQQ